MRQGNQFGDAITHAKGDIKRAWNVDCDEVDPLLWARLWEVTRTLEGVLGGRARSRVPHLQHGRPRCHGVWAVLRRRAPARRPARRLRQ